MRILHIEDNPELADTIHLFLIQGGYACEAGHTGLEADDKLISLHCDSVIPDIMLPESGFLFSICRERIINGRQKDKACRDITTMKGATRLLFLI